MSGGMCSRCGEEPRKPGQRWGKRCHAAYMRRRRAQQRRDRDAGREWQAGMRALIDELRDAR